jgi:hypothetical protein
MEFSAERYPILPLCETDYENEVPEGEFKGPYRLMMNEWVLQ